MKKVTIPLSAYSNQPTYTLIEAARRTVYVDGQATSDKVTAYTVLIRYQPVEIRVADDGNIVDPADVTRRVEAGNPMQVALEGCLLTINPVSQYALTMRGTADKLVVHRDKEQRQANNS